MTLTRYGIREWATATVVAAIVAVVFMLLHWWWALGAIIVVWLAVISFFRDPVRKLPKELAPGDMICPADGVVSAIEHVDQHDAVTGPAVIVRIFLSVLNVHVNRCPHNVEVMARRHTPGQYINAQRPESAELNEQILLTLRLTDAVFGNETIGLKQIAGMVARRIVCPLEVGHTAARGQRIGMIKFGSTTELILPRPDDVTVHVKVGDTVKGGKMVLATLEPSAQQ